MVMGTSGFLLDRTTAVKLRDSGIRAVAISLDSKDPEVHDSFRGVDGVWEKAVQAIRYCRDAGITVQINTSVMSPDPGAVEGVICARHFSWRPRLPALLPGSHWQGPADPGPAARRNTRR